jgi:hypothetical protein
MGKNKLKKFAEVQRMTHVIEPEFDEVMNKDIASKAIGTRSLGTIIQLFWSLLAVKANTR